MPSDASSCDSTKRALTTPLVSIRKTQQRIAHTNSSATKMKLNFHCAHTNQTQRWRLAKSKDVHQGLQLPWVRCLVQLVSAMLEIAQEFDLRLSLPDGVDTDGAKPDGNALGACVQWEDFA
jgi:hypothetical protein